MDDLTLEDVCFSYIFFNLELFPVDYLALLPTRMRGKLLSQLPVADVCRLEETAVVEGVDMNLVWKEKCSILLFLATRISSNILYHADIKPDLYRLVAPSTRWELRHDRGYKECCSEIVFCMFASRDICSQSEVERIVRVMLCYGYPSLLSPVRLQTHCLQWRLQSLRMNGGSVPLYPPRYASRYNHQALQAMAIHHFHPPTRLSVPRDEQAALLCDQTFVSSIEELECQDFMHIEYLKANTSWTSLESLYLKHYTVKNNSHNIILKSLLPQLKILHIHPIDWSQSDFEMIVNMFLTTPSPKKQELRLFSLSEDSTTPPRTRSFSTSVVPEGMHEACYLRSSYCLRSRIVNKVVVVGEEDLFPSLRKKYPFIVDTRKRKYEDIEQ